MDELGGLKLGVFLADAEVIQKNKRICLFRWWFQTCFIFTPIPWGNDAIFFTWVGSTTN